VNTVVTDTNTVPETGAYSGKELMFEMINAGSVDSQIILRNAGANQINYTFQEWNGTAWVDMDDVGTDLNNVLATGSPPTNILSLTVSSVYSRVRLIANASGGSTIEFLVTRFYNRAANGALPLLGL